MYERVVRPVLFRLGRGDAEAAHEWTLKMLTRLPLPRRRQRGDGVTSGGPTVFGVRFPGVVGLAAGMDKNGVALRAWPALGFGFVEVGTVTAHAQPGNPRPRLFRLPASGGVINRMGFNNEGAAALAARLAATGPIGVPIGISLGKSKVTPVAEAVDDYVASLRALRDHGDYFAINVSSPNTPGLRSLQDRSALAELLGALRAEAGGTPLLVKIAPDLTDAAIDELLEVCVEHRVAGVIATNTTIGREGVHPSDATTAEQAGGLSGSPLTARAREVVQFVHKATNGELPIIGVGGITQPDDALRLLDAGASLVQVYTGLIYHGPGLVRRINRVTKG